MSINWVMLSKSEGFTPLEGEQRLWASPARTSLSLDSAIKYPGKQPFSLQAAEGVVHLTNRRIVYLPSKPTPQFQSFAGPLLYLYDSHVTAPWFGPNVWVATLKPVPNGGIQSHIHALELKITFKDGGAYDFSSKFERVRERLQQAMEIARESNAGSENMTEQGTANGGGVNFGNVNLEELPAYSESGQTVQPPRPAGRNSPGSSETTGHRQPPNKSNAATTAPNSPQASSSRIPTTSTTDRLAAPAEPPPGYDESTSGSFGEGQQQRMTKQ